MSVRRLPLLSLALALLAACAAPAVTSPPPHGSGSPGPLDRIPVSNSVQRDGVTLTIRIDAGQVRSGDQVRLSVTATNTAAGLVMWQGGGCDLLGNVVLKGPDVPAVQAGDPPQGNDAAGIAGLIRWSALASTGSGHTSFVPPDLPKGGLLGCDSSLRINELRPGETERVEAVWHGITVDGIPAPAGAYTVTVSFPFLARQPAGPFEGDPFADAKPIAVDVPFTVAGEAWTGISAAQAVDRALADGRVRAWIGAGLQRTQIGGARIQLKDGGIWRFEVDVMSPAGEQIDVAVVEVDPTSGAITRVDVPTG